VFFLESLQADDAQVQDVIQDRVDIAVAMPDDANPILD